MVATPRKRTNAPPKSTPKHTARQSTSSRRARKPRAGDSGAGSDSEPIPHLDTTDASQTGGAGVGAISQTGTSPLVSEDYQVGDIIAYTHAPDQPMEILEIEGDRFKLKRLDNSLTFYMHSPVLVRVSTELATELAAISTPEPELKSEAENCNSTSPIETGDCVRGRTRDSDEVTGFVLSVGRTYLKLTSGKVLLMDSVTVLARLPENLEQHCELVGKSRTEKLNELLEEYQFYNLSNWKTTGERGNHFWDYNGWEMSFYKGTEVDISKDGETWYRELKRRPELKGNGKIYDYCVEAIDHAEGIIARLEEYERQATAQPETETLPELLDQIDQALIDEVQDEYEEDRPQIIVTQSQLDQFAKLISCDLLLEDKIRGTFQWDGREWVTTGGSSKNLTWNTVWAMPVVPVEQWTEPTYSYSNLPENEDGTIDRKGQLVKHKRRSLVLTGEKVEFVVATDNNPPAINETEDESIILPPLPTPHELEAAIVPNNPKQTIETLLSRLGFCPIAEDGFYPDGEPQPYRGWQINTESHEGALMAVNISEDGTEWFSLPSEADEWNFGYRGHQQAIDWAKRFIDRLIDACEKASGQLSLLDSTNDFDNSPTAIIEINPESITSTSNLNKLAEQINQLHSDCEQAIEIAQSAQQSALEHAKQAGDLLLSAKKLVEHGNWEKWRAENLKLASTTATLYQRIADRFSELQEAGISSVKAAADYLKKPRALNKSATDSQPVAEMKPIIHEKSLVDSLEGLRDNFNERKAAAAAARSAQEQRSEPDQRQTVPQDQIASVNSENGWIYTTDGRHLSPAKYKSEADEPNTVETTQPNLSPDLHLLGLDQIHYAVRKFVALNELGWSEAKVDEAATKMFDFLAEY